MSRLAPILFLVILATHATAADWPTWRFDSGRTAESPLQLPASLDLLWHRELPAPQPAFADVRLQFDGGHEPIVLGRRLFLASSRENTVTAYDTNTGGQLWQFFADGPVRLAPAAWGGHVLFGSDDGYFYSVSAESGELAWKVKAVPSERKLLANGRLASVWPVRGGAVVKDGRVYFAAGVWPFEGVFIYCLDAATGEKIWVNDSAGHIYGVQPHNAVAIGGIAPQGYLLIDGDELVVPSSNAYPGRFDLETGELKKFELPRAGRLPGGWFASLPGKTEPDTKPRKSLLADIGINVVRHEGGVRSEGLPGVRATIRTAGRELAFKEGFPGIHGEIYSMIAADDKLFVTTRAGALYAFGRSTGKPAVRYPAPDLAPPQPTTLSTGLLETIAHHGYALFLGAPDAGTLRHLATETQLHIMVVDDTSPRQIREQLVKTGLYGSRITVIDSAPATYRLPPYFADAIIVAAETRLDSPDRVFESVRPYGGKLVTRTADGLRTRSRDGALAGTTNYHGGFTASPDALVKAPLGVLWFDDKLSHFKRSPQPKFIDGVMVSTNKDWHDASTREQKIDYRLLPPTFSDVYTGRILTSEESKHINAQSYTNVDLETVQPSQYRPPTQKNPWKPDAPKAGIRTNPLTGEDEPRTFPKSYGCDGGFDYGHIYTMRSGTAAFYDKRTESGTINISGPRSGCTNSVIPANGVLNLPYFYKGCTCSYPLPTGLSMVSLPESNEQWTTWGQVEPARLTGKIQRLGINLGAPADRMTESGTLWLDYPSAGGPSPELDIETVPAELDHYYRHSAWIEGGEGWPWVAASGVEGLESLTVRGLKPGTYRVILTFANREDQSRHSTISLQGKTVAVDVISAGEMRSSTHEFTSISSNGNIMLGLSTEKGTTQLSGIEIISMQLAE